MRREWGCVPVVRRRERTAALARVEVVAMVLAFSFVGAVWRGRRRQQGRALDARPANYVRRPRINWSPDSISMKTPSKLVLIWYHTSVDVICPWIESFSVEMWLAFDVSESTTRFILTPGIQRIFGCIWLFKFFQ